MYEIIAVAFIGSSISLIEPKAAISKAKLLRKFSAGFFLSIFIANDLVHVVYHFLNFNVSLGGVVFFTAYIGASFLERVIVLINAVSIKPWKSK